MSIDMTEPVSLQFALRYLNMFMKVLLRQSFLINIIDNLIVQATTLSTQVKVSLSNDIPMMMEFDIGKIGSLKFYLAPKIEDD